MARYPELTAGQRWTASLARSMQPTFVLKTSSEIVNNSSTLQNDNELVLAVEASAQYLLSMMLVYSSASAADIKLAWSAPASATMIWVPHGIGSSVATLTGDIFTQSQSISSTPALGGAAGLTSIAHVIGNLTVAGTAGNLQFRWAQDAATASDTTVLAGSWMRLERVA